MVALHDTAPRVLDHNRGQASPTEWLAAVANALRRFCEPEPWWDLAACRGVGVEVFFPPNRTRVTSAAAELCAGCPASEACDEASRSVTTACGRAASCIPRAARPSPA